MALAFRLSKYLLSSPGVSRSSEILALITLQPKGISSFSMASCAAHGLVCWAAIRCVYQHPGVSVAAAVCCGIICKCGHGQRGKLAAVWQYKDMAGIDRALMYGNPSDALRVPLRVISVQCLTWTFILNASLPLKISMTFSMPALQAPPAQPCIHLRRIEQALTHVKHMPSDLLGAGCHLKQTQFLPRILPASHMKGDDVVPRAADANQSLCKGNNKEDCPPARIRVWPWMMPARMV
jgi:hypothetical protein